MEEILRSNNPVLLSFACSLLRDADIENHLLDDNVAGVEGSIGILARRLLVPSEEASRARRVLTEDGLARELRPVS